MIQFHKLTMEDAVIKTLTDDRSAAGQILNAKPGDKIRCRITYEYTVPANFAKAVLADYVKKQQEGRALPEMP